MTDSLINNPMKKFAVFGNPIVQSLSPTIHEMFAKQCGEQISYEKILAPEDGFTPEAKAFLAQPDAIGCNVTMPFKQDAFALANVDDQAALDAKAVNTLMKRSDGTVAGFNTDGVGLVNDLLNHGVQLKNKRVLLIGAGGAARGVIAPLIASGIASLHLTNRTKAKAEIVASETGGGKVKVVGIEDCDTVAPHIIINSTAASLSETLPFDMSPTLFAECETAYDMVYRAEPTYFMQQALSLGASRVLDGLGMLVEQAAASFTIWTGYKPQTSAVIDVLRSQLKAK
ncbi:shikimate dehydrogenase [Alteromonas stellipolaris]|jgi:shikimate dehydrogenase|nr:MULTISPECIES: shikimate dehydrogenase [Alteromonas]ALM92487.1 Shikimate 5-dehydrogenase I alpha [Alteromonas stellipolaris LMG 21856]MDO6533399.1 shikimate dehydrogenase [Alteromonas stellipolaris]MDO6538209.1 shikimate dehydrogenase [Alteromonas stellipolaris]MDO6625607.1 shikimate dehydrogenase [Alteromonas stellipolaris]MDP2595871.1 shikimate dehydrogenase [Alteromonas stellipolaris]